MLNVVIKGELPDLNTYIAAIASHRFKGGKMKKEATEMVALLSRSKRFHKMKPPFTIEFHWYCKNKKKDKDNIAFAKKFILDGLQLAEVIPQDTWNVVDGFSDWFYIDALNPRIEIKIIQTHG